MIDELVDIVDKDNKVIAQATRKDAHAKFLMHRVASTWFYNDKKEVLLQMRSKHKDTFPGTLSISESGHVDAGQTIEDTVIREIQEETGLSLSLDDLQFVTRGIFAKQPLNHLATFYAYKFTGKITDLKFDKEEVDSFVWVPIVDVYNPNSEFYGQMHPFVISKDHVPIFVAVAKLADVDLDADELLRIGRELA